MWRWLEKDKSSNDKDGDDLKKIKVEIIKMEMTWKR